MNWKIAQAKKKFSEMIRKTQKEPQIILNRNKVVAVVINPRDYDELSAIRKNIERESLASVFSKLRDICSEEDYEISVPERVNREVSWQ